MQRQSISRVLALRAFQAQHVRNMLNEAVLTGEFGAVGLPDEQYLAQEYGVSRNVIRDALDQLRQDGHLVRMPGVGTFALPPKAPHRFDELSGLQDTFGSDIVYDRVQLETVEAGRGLSITLEVPKGTPVFHLERAASIHGMPVVSISTYLPTHLLPELPALDVQDFRRHLAQAGKEPATASVTFSAVSATASTAALLDVKAGDPLLLARRVLHLHDGTPAEVGYTHYRTSLFSPEIHQTRPRRTAP